jgi:hypothetical protein
MMKKEYMKPAMRIVELRQRTHILTGSNYGLNNQLQATSDPEEEVDEGW